MKAKVAEETKVSQALDMLRWRIRKTDSEDASHEAMTLALEVIESLQLELKSVTESLQQREDQLRNALDVDRATGEPPAARKPDKFDLAFEIMRQLEAEDMETMQSCQFGYVMRVTRERAAQPPCVRQPMLDVLAITDAYESGFGHGKNLDELPNPYSEGSPEHNAYSIGYEEGERRRRVNGSSGYCNQGAHEHCTNLRQQCMCKCHSPTKESE